MAFTHSHAFWESSFSVLSVYSVQLPWLYVTALLLHMDSFLDSVIEEFLFIHKLMFSVIWLLSHTGIGLIIFCLTLPPASPSHLQFTSLTFSLMKWPLDCCCQLLKSENGAGLKPVSGEHFCAHFLYV